MHIRERVQRHEGKEEAAKPQHHPLPRLSGALTTSALPPRAHSEQGGLSLGCKVTGDSQPQALSSACAAEAELFPAARGSNLKEPALEFTWILGCVKSLVTLIPQKCGVWCLLLMVKHGPSGIPARTFPSAGIK